jgi:signal transduction histidine kinase
MTANEREHAAQESALRQQAVEREAAARTRFLKWVCHEIRNPITGVLGSLDVIMLRAGKRAGDALSAYQTELLANARSCAESISRVRNTVFVASVVPAAAAAAAATAAVVMLIWACVLTCSFSTTCSTWRK